MSEIEKIAREQEALINQLRARVAALAEVIGIYADITEQLLPAVTEPEKSRIKEFNEKAKSLLQ